MGQRYYLLDGLRGFAIYHVILFHFLYDVYVLYGLNPDWPYQAWVQLWQRNGCGLFVLVSGMVFALGRNTFRRGLQLQFLGLAITLGTAYCVPDEAIYYGILTFFGSALWLTMLLKKILQALPSWLGMLASVAGYLSTMNINRGGVFLWGEELLAFPQWFYQDTFAIFGFHSNSFHSSDYVPLLPHIFLFWFGMYLFAWLRERSLLDMLTYGNWKIFTYPGTHSLEIYILHQPLLLGLCYMIFGYAP